MKRSLLIASDHGGWKLKEKIKSHLSDIQWIDLGTNSATQSVDYPDYADLLCHKIIPQSNEPQGILICGSGQGMAMRANKFPQIRAALVWNEESSRLAREHNNANILCLGGRLLEENLALNCVKIFLTTDFAGGRHGERIEKLNKNVPPT